MNIVLFGEDIFTATVLQSLVNQNWIVSAVICPLYPDNNEYRTLERAAKYYQIPFSRKENVNDEDVKKMLTILKPRFIVCVHLRKILKRDIFSLAEYSLNVHPSLLPKYRGLSPQHQALMNGDRETGVTVHFIEEFADTGDVIMQQTIPLTTEMYIYDLQLKMLEVYKTIVREAIKLIVEKDFSPTRQNESDASWFGSLRKSHRRLDLKKSKFATYNQIRAVSKPYGGAFYDDIIIWKSYSPDLITEQKLMKEFLEIGLYEVNDEMVLRLNDGILLSDDFERATEKNG